MTIKFMSGELTKDSIKVIMLSIEEAKKMGHTFIGTEHLLLGIIGQRYGIAAKVLKKIGLTRKKTRKEVKLYIGQRKGFVVDEIFFTPRAKKVLKMAVQEARNFGQNFINPEHILLAILSEKSNVALKVLEKLNIDLEKLREMTILCLSKKKIENNSFFNKKLTKLKVSIKTLIIYLIFRFSIFVKPSEAMGGFTPINYNNNIFRSKDITKYYKNPVEKKELLVAKIKEIYPSNIRFDENEINRVYKLALESPGRDINEIISELRGGEFYTEISFLVFFIIMYNLGSKTEGFVLPPGVIAQPHLQWLYRNNPPGNQFGYPKGGRANIKMEDHTRNAGSEKGIPSNDKLEIVDKIHYDKRIVKEYNKSLENLNVKRDVENIFEKFKSGNYNPGGLNRKIHGTKHVWESRGAHGGRVYHRRVANSIELLAVSTKDNQAKVIKLLIKLGY